MYISKPFEIHMLHETEPFEHDMYKLVLTDKQYNQLMLIREQLDSFVGGLDFAYLHGVAYILQNIEESLYVQLDPDTDRWGPIVDAEVDDYAHLPELLSITVTKPELVVELQSDYAIAEGILRLDTDFDYVEDKE